MEPVAVRSTGDRHGRMPILGLARRWEELFAVRVGRAQMFTHRLSTLGHP